jgi:PAS domain S-box-containing protein
MVFDMRVMYYCKDQEQKYYLSNPAALELLGLTEDQLLGKTFRP